MRLSLFNRYDTLNDTSFQPITVQFTGPLILRADPNEPLHIATKRYVDNRLGTGLNANNITSGIVPGSRLPAFVGDVTSSVGSTVFTLSNTGVVAGNYTKFTVDPKGRITEGHTLTQSDIPNLSWDKVNVSRPTTLAGYGISDAVKATGDSLVGTLTISGNPSLPLHAVNKQYIDVLSQGLNSNEPTGTIIRRPATVAPSGFLRCNGGEVSKTTYAALYSVIGDAFGGDLMPGSGNPWRRQYAFNSEQSGDITGWVADTSLPTKSWTSQAIATKNRLYLLGGGNDSTVANKTYTAPINTDGTLGVWTVGANLPDISYYSQSIVTKNWVHLIGGSNSPTGDSSAISTVYAAPINADGTLGAWVTGTSLPGTLTQSQAVVTKNRVYLLGGHDGTASVSTVYTAPINADGTLGAWVTGTSLPAALHASQAIVTKNKVYLLDGPASYTAPINSDGTLGAWTTGASLPGVLLASQAVATKNRVYLLGGHDGTVAVSTVYTAPINPDGTLGAWTTGTSLPAAFCWSQAIVTKNRVYLLGGWNTSDRFSTVYSAPFLGGLNDYSSFYDGSILPTADSTKFRLPDYTASGDATAQYFIKYT